MKQIIRLNESQLNRIIKECATRMLNEIAGYDATMKKAYRAFNPNTRMGRLRSKLMPKKYEKYQKIGQEVNNISSGDKTGSNEWYDQKDRFGTTGEPGCVRYFETKGITYEKAENESVKHGLSIDEYLMQWFFKNINNLTWIWVDGNTYYKSLRGETIFSNNGYVCIKHNNTIFFIERP